MKNPLLLLVSLVMLMAWAEDKLPSGVDRRMYCETCLATVEELKKALNVLPSEITRAKIKAEMSKVCEAFAFEEESFTGDKARTACKHLMDLYEDKFEEVFQTEKEDTFQAHLCYIHTTACTGVKRKHFQEQQHRFEDGIIEELIQKNAGRVRRSKPTVAESSLYNTKEEL